MIPNSLGEVPMKRESKSYTIALILSLMALVLSAAIAVPLLWRGFYYLHIHALDLPEKTGWTAEEIRFAFDEMMDYCVFGEEFGTGVMKWSAEGKAHFADCEVLFRMDFTLLAVSLAAVLLLWGKGREYATVSFGNRGPLFPSETEVLCLSQELCSRACLRSSADWAP